MSINRSVDHLPLVALSIFKGNVCRQYILVRYQSAFYSSKNLILLTSLFQQYTFAGHYLKRTKYEKVS